MSFLVLLGALIATAFETFNAKASEIDIIRESAEGKGEGVGILYSNVWLGPAIVVLTYLEYQRFWLSIFGEDCREYGEPMTYCGVSGVGCVTISLLATKSLLLVNLEEV